MLWSLATRRRSSVCRKWREECQTFKYLPKRKRRKMTKRQTWKRKWQMSRENFRFLKSNLLFRRKLLVQLSELTSNSQAIIFQASDNSPFSKHLHL